MAMPDRGVGSSVKFTRFEKSAPLDVTANGIVPVLRELLVVGVAHKIAYIDQLLQARRKADSIIFGFVEPTWGEREGCPRRLQQSIKALEGGELNGENIFVGSQGAELTQSFAHGSYLLTGAHRARSIDSVLSGITVFGTGSGSNDPEFRPNQLAVISDIAGGIKDGNKEAVDVGLADLDQMMTSSERQFEGRIEDSDTTYADYDHMNAAKVFDTFYLPWLKVNNSKDIFVQRNLVHAFGTAFGGVLGGEIRDTAIVANGAVFPRANLEVVNTKVLRRRGIKYYEQETIGSPSLAREAIEATQDLAPLPLAEFAK